MTHALSLSLDGRKLRNLSNWASPKVIIAITQNECEQTGCRRRNSFHKDSNSFSNFIDKANSGSTYPLWGRGGKRKGARLARNNIPRKMSWGQLNNDDDVGGGGKWRQQHCVR